MTKFNIRILTLGYLAIDEGDKLLDLGAGTGSISQKLPSMGLRFVPLKRRRRVLDL
ncbi:MAG: hypothetical protein WCZ27_03235 [Tissierellaceae bacterium]